MYVNADFYDIDLDDGRFLMARPYRDDEEASVSAELVLVQNWFEELRQRMGN